MKRILAIASTTIVFVGASVWSGPALPLAATAPTGETSLNCPESLIEKTLANGSSWRMCARIHQMKGLVLEQIEFKPPTDREYVGYKRVLDHLSLAQLNVPYDNGVVQYNDITSYGFGGEHLMSQTKTTCPGTAIDVTQTTTNAGGLVSRTIPGICAQEIDTGLSTHSLEEQSDTEIRVAEQGSALEISSLSKISWYEYQQNIKLDDHGQLDIGLGATGDVAPGGPGGTMFSPDLDHGWPLGGVTTASGERTHAASHWHNAVWKVDFGIDQGERQYVEQWDYANSAEPPLLPQLTGSGVRRDRAFSAVPDQDIDEQTWFRVLNPDSLNLDGHPRSYEIVNQNDPHSEMPVFAPVVTFTNSRACEEYASMNLNADCPNRSILDYVADDTGQLDDPIAWVNVGFHHIDRDEDQSPMQMHWQRFQLVPRDFFAQKPGISDQRSCLNGAGWIDSYDSPCVATNIVVPTISAEPGTPTIGTALRVDPGVWNESRTNWTYQYLWFRDGQPIIVTADGEQHPANTPDYIVRADDLGMDIAVRVTASQIGFPSGTAESAPLAIPGLPQPPAKAASSIKVIKKKARVGHRATVVVRVTATGATPTGRVTIQRRGKVIRAKQLVDGRARFKLKAPKKGRHKLRIRYAGSATVSPSTKRITLHVGRADHRVR